MARSRVAVAKSQQRIIEPSWRQVVDAFIRVLEEKDPYTRGHSQRVQEYSVLVAKVLGWDEFRVHCTSIASLLHDLGKIIVDRTTLQNQLPTLTPEQLGELANHPYYGAQMVRGLFPPEVVLAILQHHERMDGRVEGVPFPAYPFGLPGRCITPIARVIAVCDTFDALTTHRSYQPAIPKREALTMLQEEAGSRHDARVVRVFVKVVAPRLPACPRSL
jgi:HD-GYP domain-containing protein (c-di-GMP phosphodiesterase class II)